MTGFCVAFTAYLIEYVPTKILKERFSNLNYDNYYFSFINFLVSAIILATIGTGVCHAFGPEARIFFCLILI